MKQISAIDAGGRFNYSHPREGDEERRWRCMARNMAQDSRLDKEGAQRLLSGARKLHSSTAERMAVLDWEFAERFGSVDLEPQTRPGRFRE